MAIDKHFKLPEMTIELALDRINQILDYKSLGMSEYEIALDTASLQMAIASLEVWEKIKKESEHKKFSIMEVKISDTHLGFNGGLECTLVIINKHFQEVKE